MHRPTHRLQNAVKPCPPRVFFFLLGSTALFFLQLYIFYPGYMSVDSLQQYGMAISHTYTDWHPPLMSWLWSILMYIFPGPGGLLIFHFFLLSTSVFIFFYHFKDNKFAWIFFLIPLLPWVINFSGVLWKDVGMAFCFLGAAAISLLRRSALSILAAYLLIFYAINVRHEAFIAAIPLVFFLIRRWLPHLSRIKALTIATSLFASFFIFGYFLNYTMLDSKKTSPERYLIQDDLAYLSLVAKKSLLPHMALEEIQSCATHTSGLTKLVQKIACLKDYPNYLQHVTETKHWSRLWVSALLEHPFDYLQFRFAAFLYFLRSPSVEPYSILYYGIDNNAMGLSHTPHPLAELIKNYVFNTSFKAPFLFKPYWWLTTTVLLLLATSFLKRSDTVRLIQCLLTSSIFYILIRLPLTAQADFRYAYWSILATSISIILFALEKKIYQKVARPTLFAITCLALVISLGLYFFERVVTISPDQLVDQSLAGSRTTVRVEPSFSGFSLAGGAYTAIHSTPHLLFDLSHENLSSTAADYMKFTFQCYGQQMTPRIRASWWGEAQTNPTPAPGSPQIVTQGTNLIALRTAGDFSSLGRLLGLRLDFLTPLACERFTLRDLTLIERRPTPP